MMEKKTLVGLGDSRWIEGDKPSFQDEVGRECVWRGLISIDVDVQKYLQYVDASHLNHFEPPMDEKEIQLRKEIQRRQTMVDLLGKDINKVFYYPIEVKELHLREIVGKGLEMVTDQNGKLTLMFFVSKTNTIIPLPFDTLVKRYSTGIPKVCKAAERYTTTTVAWLSAFKQAIEENLSVIPFDFYRYHQANFDQGVYELLEAFTEDYASQTRPFTKEVQSALLRKLHELEDKLVTHMEASMTQDRKNMYVHFLEHAFDKSIFQNPLFAQNKIIQAYRVIRKKLHLYFHGADSEFNEPYFLKIKG